MALSEEQKELIKTEVRIGDLSNRSIAKKVKCSESAVRTLIKKENIEKNAINALAKKKIQNIIIQEETDEEINALKNAEKRSFQKQLIDLAVEKNLFDQDVINNQQFVREAQIEISKQIAQDPEMIVDKIQYMYALSKMQETNRKQLFGPTQPIMPEEKDDKPKIRKYIIRKEDKDDE